jgi:hypothetical protein
VGGLKVGSPIVGGQKLQIYQENLAIMYLKKYMDNDLWESLYQVLVVKRKDEELEAWVEILEKIYNVFEDPTKYLSKLHNTNKYNQVLQEAPRSYHARLQAVWAKAYLEKKRDPTEDTKYHTRFVLVGTNPHIFSLKIYIFFRIEFDNKS